jgi:hypothetical protein
MSNAVLRSWAVSLLILVVAQAVPPSAQAASDRGACGMISASEIRNFWGKDLAISDNSLNIPQAKSCLWSDKDPNGAQLMIQIVPARYYEPHHGAGYHTLSGIGSIAYVVPELGGWTAMAVKGKQAVAIGARGGKIDESKTVSVLRMIVSKM